MFISVQELYLLRGVHFLQVEFEIVKVKMRRRKCDDEKNKFTKGVREGGTTKIVCHVKMYKSRCILHVYAL